MRVGARQFVLSLARGNKLAAEAGDDFAAGVLRGDVGGLAESAKALAAWARQIPRDPNTDASDVRRLRDAGFDDARMFAIAVFVALRIASSTVNDALDARPDWQLANVVPPNGPQMGGDETVIAELAESSGLLAR